MNLSRIAFSPKSGEQEDQIAPRQFVARKEMIVSGVFAATAATLSPLVIPIDFKYALRFLTFF